jgi:hypothetical protein
MSKENKNTHPITNKKLIEIKIKDLDEGGQFLAIAWTNTTVFL